MSERKQYQDDLMMNSLLAAEKGISLRQSGKEIEFKGGAVFLGSCGAG